MRLKRRSLFSAEISDLPQNDDNLEQSRRLSVASPNVRSRQRMSTDAPHVLGSDMIVHFTQCLKLSSENKINPGNAFQLEMIDYMISMLSSKDSKMDNFQIASFTLDASTKIYASRVDKVHSDGMKIAGGLFKAVVRKEKQGAVGDDHDDDGPDGHKAESKARQRARRRVRKIITEPESLNAPLQQNYKLHPSLLFMNTKFSDCRPGCVNLMPRISVVGDTQKLQFLCSEPALGSSDVGMEDQLADVPTLSDLTNLKITSHKIEPADFLDDDLATGMGQCVIGEGLDLSVVTEKLKMDLQLENNFEDDPCQGSVLEAHEDDGDREPSNSPEVHNFDIRSHLSSKSQEYSYFNIEKLSLWRGPSHWKVFASKDKTDDTEKVRRKQRPKKKVKNLFPEEPEQNIDEKLQKGRSQKLTKRTTQKWQESKVTSQPDVHYENSHFRRLYHNTNFLIKFVSERNLPMSGAEVVDDGDAVNYDYCNPNDTLEYCPNVPNCDESSSSEHEDDGHELQEVNGHPVTPTRDERESVCQWKLLTPPTVATKISIPYAKESKKVDMARLKATMWSILKQFSACNSDKQNGKLQEIVGVLTKPEGTVTHFSKLLSETKATWPDDTKAELSFAIVFQALLHLTNEKKMHLKSNDDLSDAIIFCPKSSCNI
ncbi:condensin complex subunit 2-like isoform X1 [Schistocerca gregaria]|uniref:condensin complex subunit 2-like isoform X1 n=2 Tax=Schistocerca gregaria TaxID=7010 RepID=UPI00211E9345|nr:condensin complex subunit 2-like isoform X1 [Schistocerca gregaria]XP_049844301.1 condensin complex subunit 2-like isoform X1 [Schistocerca gregaria]